MLVAKKALKSITEAFLKSVKDYGIEINDEAGNVADSLEEVLAEHGVLVEEEVSFNDLNNTQHASWVKIAESYVPDSDKACLTWKPLLNTYSISMRATKVLSMALINN